MRFIYLAFPQACVFVSNHPLVKDSVVRAHQLNLRLMNAFDLLCFNSIKLYGKGKVE